MAIVSSGQVKFVDLRTEWSQSGQVRLSDYYNGGGIVSDASVPSSGQIKISDFYGLSAGDLIAEIGTSGSPVYDGSTDTNTGSGFQNGDGVAIAGWKFGSDGILYKTGIGPLTQDTIATQYLIQPWCWNGTDNTPSQTYYIRATALTGDNASSGTYNTWLALSSDQTWYWQAAGGGDSISGAITFEISTLSDGSNIVATSYLGGNASVDP